MPTLLKESSDLERSEISEGGNIVSSSSRQPHLSLGGRFARRRKEPRRRRSDVGRICTYHRSDQHLARRRPHAPEEWTLRHFQQRRSKLLAVELGHLVQGGVRSRSCMSSVRA